MAQRIQLRRGTAATWAAANPVLAASEYGYETDTGRVKLGDGTTAWTSLPYSAGDGLTQLRKSADQTLPNGTWTMLTWDVEDQDTYGLHESVTNPSRVTFTIPGVYLLNFNCGIGASTVNDRYAAFYKNGAEMPGRVTGKGQTYTELVLSKIVSVTAGDYIQAGAYQDSGSTLTLFASTPITNMLTIRRLGVL